MKTAGVSASLVSVNARRNGALLYALHDHGSNHGTAHGRERARPTEPWGHAFRASLLGTRRLKPMAHAGVRIERKPHHNANVTRAHKTTKVRRHTDDSVRGTPVANAVARLQ